MNNKPLQNDTVPFSELVAGDRYCMVDDENGHVCEETFLVTDHADDSHGLLSVSLTSGATTWSAPQVPCSRKLGPT